MKNKTSFRYLSILLVFLFCFSSITPSNSVQAAVGQKAAAVTAHPYATAIALEVLQSGGNAVDAAIAAQWMLNVVEPQSSGIGGGGFFLYYEAATRQIYSFDGREAAPGNAFPEMFLDKNKEPYVYKDRITGGLPVGVPGTLKLLKTVYDRFSSKKLSFNELFRPAIRVAERGFPASPRLVMHIDQEKERLAKFPESKKLFLDEKGDAVKAGTIIFQPGLAKTFRLIQDQGILSFYEGEIAQSIVDAVRNAPFHPGLMEKQDLAEYKIYERDPVTGDYRGYQIFSMGPPSSGGTTLIEALHILEGYELRRHGVGAESLHLLSEAQKIAFQDRNQFLGDPAYSKIPLEKLLSKEFAKQRSQEISVENAIPTTFSAVRPLHLEGTHTSHISIIDEFGNMVAYTTTIESLFGSGMIVPGRGFFLNNELTDFNEIPNDDNGRLTANAPEGDKRPRSSMTPTFVFKNGEPVLIIGSPGGSAIIGAVLNVIVNVIDFDMSLHDAIHAPRLINRNGPIEMEPPLFQDATIRRKLEQKGHPVTQNPAFGNVQAIKINQDSQQFIGESDPRGEGVAEGY